MKIGLNTNLGITTPEVWAKTLHDLGCESAVFPVKYYDSEEVIQDYLKAAKDNQLMIAEVGAWSNPICPDKEIRKGAMEKSIGQLALADRIGARCCVNIAGALGLVWDGAYKENFSREAWDLTVKSIQKIIDEVQPRNTYYTIEAMPWMFPMGPDQYLHLIEDVNRRQFGVHMDICNWITSPERYFFHEEFMEECFEKLGPYIRSCHLKNVILKEGYTFLLKEVSCEEGGLNLKKYIHLADEVDSDMPMLLEHLDSNEAYLQGLKYVKEHLV